MARPSSAHRRACWTVLICLAYTSLRQASLDITMPSHAGATSAEGEDYEAERAARIAQNHARMQVRLDFLGFHSIINITHLLVCAGSRGGRAIAGVAV